MLHGIVVALYDTILDRVLCGKLIMLHAIVVGLRHTHTIPDDMATSRLFRKVLARLSAHMRIIMICKAFRPHLNHKASKLPIESSSSVAVDRDCKMSTGSRQAVAKLCAARPLRFYWQPLVAILEMPVERFSY